MLRTYLTCGLVAAFSVFATCQAQLPFSTTPNGRQRAETAFKETGTTVESVIRFVPDSEPPFQLNTAAAQLIEKRNNQLADKQLQCIMSQLALLISEHPESTAVATAKSIIDSSDYILTPNGGLYPKGTLIVGGLAILR